MKGDWKEWYPKEKKPPTPIPWWAWQVPELKGVHYLLMMFLLLVGIPWFLGIRFTSFSIIINVLLCDFILYSWYKRV
jgi:hypothetical protein|tara:strand:+ start:239 stop:469 length:231 start_codon:yes stop_codon:yes gene_type:complete